MKRRTISAAALSLTVAAFVAGYVVNLVFGSAGATPTAGAASPATLASASKTSSVDSAYEKAYDTARRSVVFIKNPGVGTGSGIVYDTNGDVVTNAHVVSGGKKFRVTFSNGRTVPATLVGRDTADDLAVIHVNAGNLTPATFARRGSYRVAETVLAIGSPLGLRNSVTAGLISGIDRTQQEPNGAYIPRAIQTSAPINPGNSGGALVDLNGVVVGIPTMVQTTTTGNETVQDVGFAIPSGRVTYIANQIISTGRVQHTRRAFLGVSVGDSGEANTPFGYFGHRSVSGAVVTRIESGGPAARAGIQTGDVITKIAGTRVSSADDLLTRLASLKPGDSVTITYSRNGSSHTGRVHLSELPAN